MVEYTKSAGEIYKQSIRGKISAIADSVIEDAATAAAARDVYFGERVRFRFMINADGSLGGFEILEGSTIASQEFRELALQVLEAAAPFDPVPQDALNNSPGITYVLEIVYMED
ncbi:MAG: hypothetical protein KC897_02790 [Candidatus Omnitrophica bacterium]|nr:hypothetical protein [Candidatus Omnitrophota bacterium]MCB9722225.1 hypothetical protein [Candidatus Omnitrophota bacterium]